MRATASFTAGTPPTPLPSVRRGIGVRSGEEYQSKGPWVLSFSWAMRARAANSRCGRVFANCCDGVATRGEPGAFGLGFGRATGPRPCANSQEGSNRTAARWGFGRVAASLNSCVPRRFPSESRCLDHSSLNSEPSLSRTGSAFATGLVAREVTRPTRPSASVVACSAFFSTTLRRAFFRDSAAFALALAFAFSRRDLAVVLTCVPSGLVSTRTPAGRPRAASLRRLRGSMPRRYDMFRMLP